MSDNHDARLNRAKGPSGSSYRTPRRRLTSRKLILLAVIIGVEFLLFWRPRGQRDEGITSSAALPAPPGTPQNVVHERKQLKEGQSSDHSFFLFRDSRVHLEVTATPAPVDVMVMTSDEAAKFQKGQGRFLAFLAPEYTYRKTMSAQEVTTMDRTDILPAGSWVIVITRPRESVFFKKDTSVSTALTTY